MFASIGVLFLLPWLDTSKVRSCRYRPIYKWFFWILVIDCVVLGWVGANPPEGWFPTIGLIGTIYYFFHFLILLPILGKIETPLPLPTSISETVTGAPAGATAPAGGDD
jgi:ubiquinol-cytochrome c reductase cytochrome b subunit